MVSTSFNISNSLVSYNTIPRREKIMFCPSCGSEIPTSGKFCPECGDTIPGTQKENQEQEGSKITRDAEEPRIKPRRAPPSEVQGSEKITYVGEVVPRRSARAIAPPRSKSSKAGLAFVMILILFGAVFAVITVLTWGSYSGKDQRIYSPAVPNNSSSWRFEVDTAHLEVGFSSNLSAPEVVVDINYDWAGAFMKDKIPVDLYNITWETTGTDKVFKLDYDDYQLPPMIQNTAVIVTLNPNVEFDLNLVTITGSLWMNTTEAKNITNIDATTSTGSIIIDVEDNVNITGNLDAFVSTGSIIITSGENVSFGGNVTATVSTGGVDFSIGTGSRIQGITKIQSNTGSTNVVMQGVQVDDDAIIKSTTGSVYYRSVNLTYGNDIDLNISSSTGSVDMFVDQFVDPLANVTANVETSTGGIDINYKGDDVFVSATFEAHESGTPDFDNNGGFEVLPGNSIFRSINQGNPARFDCKATVSTGSIYISGQMV